MKLKEFILKAKKNTYANNKKPQKIDQIKNAKRIIFKEDNFEYQDIYFGFYPFIGEEIIIKNNKVIWSMNYYGKITEKITDSKQIYNFLREALRKANIKKPFRGPELFEKNKFRYENKIKGTITEFSGSEKIFFENKEVYRLIYHGGTIKNKQI